MSYSTDLLETIREDVLAIEAGQKTITRRLDDFRTRLDRIDHSLGRLSGVGEDIEEIRSIAAQAKRNFEEAFAELYALSEDR